MPLSSSASKARSLYSGQSRRRWASLKLLKTQAVGPELRHRKCDAGDRAGQRVAAQRCASAMSTIELAVGGALRCPAPLLTGSSPVDRHRACSTEAGADPSGRQIVTAGPRHGKSSPKSSACAPRTVPYGGKGRVLGGSEGEDKEEPWFGSRSAESLPLGRAPGLRQSIAASSRPASRPSHPVVLGCPRTGSTTSAGRQDRRGGPAEFAELRMSPARAFQGFQVGPAAQVLLLRWR